MYIINTIEQRFMTFLENKYRHYYYSIINAALSRKILPAYYEKHHIIPRSLGGEDDEQNLVALTAREHFVCHKLLVKITEGKNRAKMSYGLWQMAQINQNQQRIKISSREYNRIRESLSEARAVLWDDDKKAERSKKYSGEGNPFYGKKHTEESKQKQREKMTGRPVAPEVLARRESRAGENNTFYGKKHSAETKRKISEARKRHEASKNSIA